MPTILRSTDLAEQVAALTDRLARLERASGVVDDVSIWRVGFENYLFDDTSAALSTVHETTFTPRGASLTLGLSFYGDFVGTSPQVNTGGTWDVLLNGVSSASGTVPATYTIVETAPVLDLSPYLGVRDLHVEVRTRRTAGATTGGRYGGGGCIASIVRYARIS